MSLTNANQLLEYRLLEADIRHYHASGRAWKCWRSCRRRKLAVVLLLMLGFFLIGVCYRSHGVRAGSLALGTTLVILAGLAWSRDALDERRVCRLARGMGIPRDVRLVIWPDGIAEEADPDGSLPSRTFAWSEVVDVIRIDHLTVIRFRPAGSVLIVPDRAFATPEIRDEFVKNLQASRESALH